VAALHAAQFRPPFHRRPQNANCHPGSHRLRPSHLRRAHLRPLPASRLHPNLFPFVRSNARRNLLRQPSLRQRRQHRHQFRLGPWLRHQRKKSKTQKIRPAILQRQLQQQASPKIKLPKSKPQSSRNKNFSANFSSTAIVGNSKAPNSEFIFRLRLAHTPK